MITPPTLDCPFNFVLGSIISQFPAIERLRIGKGLRKKSPLDDVDISDEDIDEWGFDENTPAYKESSSIVAEYFEDHFSENSCLLLCDIKPAVLWYAAAKRPLATLLVGSWLYYKHDEEETEEDGLALIQEAAERGNAVALWMLGERFSRMSGGMEEAVHCLGKSAQRGFKQAKDRLHFLYERPMNLKDTRGEIKWTRIYAEAGITEAQFEYAFWLYTNNKLDQAFDWMLKAAQGGHTTAQARLAYFYEQGEGCTRNLEQAAYWRERANVEPTDITDSPNEVMPVLDESKVCIFDPDLGEAPADLLTENTEAEVNSLPEDHQIEIANFLPSDRTDKDPLDGLKASHLEEVPPPADHHFDENLEDAVPTQILITEAEVKEPVFEESTMTEAEIAEPDPYSIVRPSRPYQSTRLISTPEEELAPPVSSIGSDAEKSSIQKTEPSIYDQVTGFFRDIVEEWIKPKP